LGYDEGVNAMTNPHKDKKIWDLTEQMVSEIPEDELIEIILENVRRFDFHVSFKRELILAIGKELDYMRTP